MKQILTILFISLLFSNSALAKSLLDVLKEAYQNNTELNAERENLIIFIIFIDNRSKPFDNSLSYLIANIFLKFHFCNFFFSLANDFYSSSH